MSFRTTAAAIVLRAALAGVAVSSLALVTAAPASAASFAERTTALALSIQRAAQAAQADAASQGLDAVKTKAAIETAVAAVVAQSGEDSGVILAALRMVRQSTTYAGRASGDPAVLALGELSQQISMGLMASGYGPGGSAPSGSSLTTSRVGGGSDYKKPGI